MADSEEKQMSTIIFVSNLADDQTKSIEALVNALKADGRCEHKICFRPITTNFFQFIRGVKDDDKGMFPIGCHEILYLPINRKEEIERLERNKNVIIKINSMCFVGDSDKKKKKLKNIIDWLLEETEEITL